MRAPSAHAKADAALSRRIRTVHVTSRATDGLPRVHAEPRASGERHGRKRIARPMREAGLVGIGRRRGGPVTARRDREARPAPEVADRSVSADAPNRPWVADITFMPTLEGVLNLAVALDAWSRTIVGSSAANHLRTELALAAAATQRRPRDVIHPSDPGVAGHVPGPRALPRGGPAAVDGFGRRRLRRCHGRERLRHAGLRTAGAPAVYVSGRGAHRRLQLR